MPASRMLTVEWFDPASGKPIRENPIPAGSPAQPFKTPFSSDAVLYLADSTGHR